MQQQDITISNSEGASSILGFFCRKDTIEARGKDMTES